LTVGAAAPLQAAGAYALRLPREYYEHLQSDYLARREKLLPVLREAGFDVYVPDGAYYAMTDISAFGFADDVAFTRHLVREIGVACVPGSSFYSRPELGANQVRFCFCKKMRRSTPPPSACSNSKSSPRLESPGPTDGNAEVRIQCSGLKTGGFF
jgi:aminotransferase